MAIHYRRNINCLSSNQLHDLREALTTLYTRPEADSESYATIAGLHGSPSPSYCIHGYPGFLTWHRAYMDAFERLLRCINSSISLPYWDWSSGPSTGVPTACAQPTYVNRSGDTVANPLYSGPIASAAGGGQTARRADIDSTSFDDLATSAQSAMGQSGFAGFQSGLNGPHGGVHVRVGGEMSSVARASYDPLFYLHHCNVDRLWAKWQQSHPGPLPSNEASLPLNPFYRQYSNTLRNGSEFASTDELGYRYSSFCFFLPDWDLIRPLLRLRFDPDVLRRRPSEARLVLNSSKMPARSMELRVFVNEPEASEKTPTDGNPRFAGSFPLFGMGKEKLKMAQSHAQRFDTEIDVSAALQRLDDKDQQLEMTLVPVDLNGKSLASKHVNAEGFELLLK
jgi:hypothetical protein